jgi:hypothetical protein
MNAHKERCQDGTGNFRRSYRKWTSMHRRCEDRAHPAFYRYGLRGISVCDRWSGHHGYENFVADMGEPPPGLTLDRINNDGNYEPGNCRWATWKEQAANRKKRTASAPNPDTLYGRARLAGLPGPQVYSRVHRLGWTEARALSTPIGPRGRRSAVMDAIARERIAR